MTEQHQGRRAAAEPDTELANGTSAGSEAESYGNRRLARIDALGRSLQFVKRISPNDEMSAGGPEDYYRWGLAALDYVQFALRAAEFPGSPRRILDLPCGHGRVMRMLKAAFPDAEITACDLNLDGLEFCAREFGAKPVVSHEIPQRVELPARYDLIWVGSLLTHVTTERWHAFLKLFAEHLEAGGVLVFTTLGRTIVGELRRGERSVAVPDLDGLIDGFERSGFAYQDYVSQTGYGIALARPRWVCEQLQQRSSLQLVAYTEGGWFGRQDAVACRRSFWA